MFHSPLLFKVWKSDFSLYKVLRVHSSRMTWKCNSATGRAGSPLPSLSLPLHTRRTALLLGTQPAGTVTEQHPSITALSLASRLRPPLCKVPAGGIPAPLYPSARLRQGVLPVRIARGSFFLHRPQVMPSSAPREQDAAFDGDRSCTVSVCCVREAISHPPGFGRDLNCSGQLVSSRLPSMRVHPALWSHWTCSRMTPCRLLGKPGAASMCVLLWPHYYLLIPLSLGRHSMQTKSICRKTSPGELWKLHFNRTQFTLPGNNWRLVVSSRELNSPSTLSIPIDSCDIYVLFSCHPFGARHVPVCLIVCNHPAHHGGFWGLQAAHCLVWSPSPSGSPQPWNRASGAAWVLVMEQEDKRTSGHVLAPSGTL